MNICINWLNHHSITWMYVGCIFVSIDWIIIPSRWMYIGCSCFVGTMSVCSNSMGTQFNGKCVFQSLVQVACRKRFYLYSRALNIASHAPFLILILITKLGALLRTYLNLIFHFAMSIFIFCINIICMYMWYS